MFFGDEKGKALQPGEEVRIIDLNQFFHLIKQLIITPYKVHIQSIATHRAMRSKNCSFGDYTHVTPSKWSSKMHQIF